MSDLVITACRRDVLKQLAEGRRLKFQPHVLHQPDRYFWADNRQFVPASTVRPLERAGLVSVHPADYYQRVITSAGRAALAMEG